MRLVIALSLALAAVAVLAVADLLAPAYVDVGRGSYGFPVQADAFELLPAEDGCDERSSWDDPCPQRYAYAPNEALTMWISVRNGGFLPITLNGVSQDWIDQYPPYILGRPTAGLDGGDPSLGWQGGDPVPSEPVVLNPGDQRAVGLQFRTSDDLAFLCQHWGEGNGIGWEFVPITWRLLFFEHEQRIDFDEPIVFMAPTAADCSG
jgi:hypothetical protein